MNVTNKTTRTFDILNLTEYEAQDLLNIAARFTENEKSNEGEFETLNKLRRALLDAGIRKGKENAS